MSQVARLRNHLAHRLPPPVAWIVRQELIVLLGVFLIFFGVWGFIEVTDEVVEGDTQRFDVWVVENLRKPEMPTEPVGPHWLKTGAVDLTALGGVSIICVMILAVIGYLALGGKYHAMWYVLAASVGGMALSFWMKTWFDRERPSVVPHLTEVSTTSFPSAHAMMSAVIYLTLGALLARFAGTRLHKLYFLGLGIFLTLLIGSTRVYLGVHYPTDVLAGWCAGVVWAILCWVIARYLQKEGKVETAGKPEDILEEEGVG